MGRRLTVTGGGYGLARLPPWETRLRRASSRRSSKIRSMAAARLARASRSVRPWPFAPGTSGHCAMYQSPSRSKIAVKVLPIAATRELNGDAPRGCSPPTLPTAGLVVARAGGECGRPLGEHVRGHPCPLARLRTPRTVCPPLGRKPTSQAAHPSCGLDQALDVRPSEVPWRMDRSIPDVASIVQAPRIGVSGPIDDHFERVIASA